MPEANEVEESIPYIDHKKGPHSKKLFFSMKVGNHVDKNTGIPIELKEEYSYAIHEWYDALISLIAHELIVFKLENDKNRMISMQNVAIGTELFIRLYAFSFQKRMFEIKPNPSSFDDKSFLICGIRTDLDPALKDNMIIIYSTAIGESKNPIKTKSILIECMDMESS